MSRNETCSVRHIDIEIDEKDNTPILGAGIVETGTIVETVTCNCAHRGTGTGTRIGAIIMNCYRYRTGTGSLVGLDGAQHNVSCGGAFLNSFEHGPQGGWGERA